MAFLTTRPAGERIEQVDMTVAIRVDEQKRLTGRRKGDRVKHAGTVVQVKRAVLGWRLVHGDPEIEGAVAIDVGDAERVRPPLPFVLRREPFSRSVSEGAVADPDQHLNAPAAEVGALETGKQVGMAVAVDVETREANEDRRRAERLRR